MLEHGDCQGCPDAPTIFLSQIVDGELRTYNLCRDCPHMDEVDDPAGCALVEMLLKISQANHPQAPEAEDEVLTEEPEDEVFSAEDAEEEEIVLPELPVKDTRSCECGMTLETIEKSQRLGCPTCYETFRHALVPLLRGSQTRGERHRGKVPAGLRRGVTLSRAELEAELAEAIDLEDFERAAQLRDLLRQLGHSLRG